MSKPALPIGVQVPARIHPVSTVLALLHSVHGWFLCLFPVNPSIHPFINPSIFWILLQPDLYRSQDAVHSRVNFITEVCHSVNHRVKLILSVSACEADCTRTKAKLTAHTCLNKHSSCCLVWQWMKEYSVQACNWGPWLAATTNYKNNFFKKIHYHKIKRLNDLKQ